MRVLVVGGGAREHALAWRLRQCASVAQVDLAPGNGATGGVHIGVADVAGLVAWCRRERPSLVVVGPEEPLAAGLVDRLTEADIPAFGPTAAAARLESSKVFAKRLMGVAGVPTARWASFSRVDLAMDWIGHVGGPVVVKRDGLAGGKGVRVCADLEDAEAAVRAVLAVDCEVVVEERVDGVECSLLAFVDGERFAVMPAAQDHKRLMDGDAGPNTGGMGAVAPTPAASGREEALASMVIAPIVDEMARRGTPFRGVLYAGLMLTDWGPKVLEYNVRFGDPEAQVLLPLFDGDLASTLLACTAGRLDPREVRWRAGAACAVVAATAGYPLRPGSGDPIEGLEQAAAVEGVTLFFGGVRWDGKTLVTDGGRVVTVTAVDEGLAGAIRRAYVGLDQLRFPGLFARRDIGASPAGGAP